MKHHEQLLSEHEGKNRNVYLDAMHVMEELIERPVKVIAGNISVPLFLKCLNNKRLIPRLVIHLVPLSMENMLVTSLI